MAILPGYVKAILYGYVKAINPPLRVRGPIRVPEWVGHTRCAFIRMNNPKTRLPSYTGLLLEALRGME
jgi:hypothetical protein